MIQRSLSLRILLVNFVLLILPLLLYFFLVFRFEYKGEISKAAMSLLELAESRADFLSQMIHSGYETLDVIGDLVDFSADDPALENQMLAKFSSFIEGHEIDFFTENEAHEFIVSASSLPYKIGLNYTFREFIREAKEHGFSSSLAYHTGSEDQDLFLSKALYSKEKFLGVLSFVLSSKYLLKKLVSTEYAPYKARLSLLTEEGIVFTSSDPHFDLYALFPISSELLRDISKSEQFGSFDIKIHPIEFTPITGVQGALEWNDGETVRIGVQVRVKGSSFSIFIDCDENAVVEGFYKHLFQLIIVITLATIIVSLINLWLTHRIATPLKQLFNVMHEISSGNYQRRFQKDAFGYEINSIGVMLNEMVVNLEKNMEVAKRARIEREILAKELKIGREIQMSILPQEVPQMGGVEVAAASLPALEVGGDFFDVYQIQNPTNKEENRLILTIADGAGKGISACLYSLSLRSILRSYASEYMDVAKLTELANNLYYLDSEKSLMFVTALTASFEPKAKTFYYYSAGHPPCIVRKKGGKIVRLPRGGMAMGVEIMHSLILSPSITLESDDIVILYSDGITDAQNELVEFYGEARFLEALKKSGALSASEMIEYIFKDIEAFSAGAKQYDDITLVIMRVL